MMLRPTKGITNPFTAVDRSPHRLTQPGDIEKFASTPFPGTMRDEMSKKNEELFGSDYKQSARSSLLCGLKNQPPST